MSNYELAGAMGGIVVGGGIGFGLDVLLDKTGLLQGFNYDTRLVCLH